MPDVKAGTVGPERRYWRENRIQCRDGYQFSVVAGWGAYCAPRPDGWGSLGGVPADYSGPFTHVEVGFFNGRTPRERAWRHLMDGSSGDFAGATSVAGYVPVRMVYDLIRRHGGEAKYIGVGPMSRERRPREVAKMARALAAMQNHVKSLMGDAT